MKFLKFLLLFFCSILFAQNGFEVKNADKTVIPFQFINNLVLVPVTINGVQLTFLLDTGVSETLLFSLDNKQVDFNEIEKMRFSGLGENISVEGLISTNNTVSIGKNFADTKHTVFIILDENFNFSSNVGVPVNGILGYQFFKNHPIKIDYIRKKITVFNSQKSFEKEKKKYKEIPITIEGNKPYVNAEVEMTNQKSPSKLLIDMGNSDSLWLFPVLIKDFVYNRPNIDDYLGRGFNGDIFGKRSRIHNIYLGDFKLQKPMAAMPDEYSIQNLNIVKDRKGSIGDDILRRFNVIFDYQNEKIYLKKNSDFDDPFTFNMSGIDVKNDGLEWDKDIVKVETPRVFSSATDDKSGYSASGEFQYKFSLKPIFSVAGCRPGSPAYIAGVRKGDRILTINKKPVKDMNLEKIGNILKSKEGELIKMEIERDKKILKFEFTLEDPIPYQENQ